MLKKMLVMVMIFAHVFQAQAAAMDIYGDEESLKFIKVTEYTSNGKTKDYVGFELCSKAHTDQCEQIGSKKYYSKAKLAKLRKAERADVLYAVLADVGVVLVGLYGGGITGAIGLSAAMGEAGTMLGVSVGSLSGIGGAIVVTKYVDAVNPFEQGRQVKVLADDILNDKDVSMDRQIEDIAHTLRTVLSNLK